MAFPSTASRRRTAFWLIMLVAGFIAGIVLVNFEATVEGRNPFSVQMERIAASDGSGIGLLVAVIGFVVLAYMFFGIWVMVSLVIYSLLSWFDDDLWTYTKQMLGAVLTSPKSDAEQNAIDIAWRAILLTYIAGFLGFIAFAIYFGGV